MSNADLGFLLATLAVAGFLYNTNILSESERIWVPPATIVVLGLFVLLKLIESKSVKKELKGFSTYGKVKEK